MAACSPWAERTGESDSPVGSVYIRCILPVRAHRALLVLVLAALRGRRLSLSPFWSSECSGVYREEQFAVVSTWDLFSLSLIPMARCDCWWWCVVLRDIPLKRRRFLQQQRHEITPKLNRLWPSRCSFYDITAGPGVCECVFDCGAISHRQSPSETTWQIVKRERESGR